MCSNQNWDTFNVLRLFSSSSIILNTVSFYVNKPSELKDG